MRCTETVSCPIPRTTDLFLVQACPTTNTFPFQRPHLLLLGPLQLLDHHFCPFRLRAQRGQIFNHLAFYSGGIEVQTLLLCCMVFVQR
jgi:hypothetical protein